MDRRVGRDLVAKLASDIPIASDGEVTELSRMMNEALKMVGDADGCHAWFKLFRAIDDDGSGRISYAGSRAPSAIRSTSSALPCPSASSSTSGARLTTTTRGSSTGEFGRFMKRGEVVQAPAQLKVHEENRAAARAEKAMLAELTGQDLRETHAQGCGARERGGDALHFGRVQSRNGAYAEGEPRMVQAVQEMDHDGSELICS